MKVGTLFTRVIPQARNRGWMMIAGFDPSVNQKTMVRYVTLGNITEELLAKAQAEISKMLGAEKTEDVTKGDVAKKLQNIMERQELNGRLLRRWTY